MAADLDLRLDTLRAVDAVPGALLDAFRDFLLTAPDEALFRVSPIRWAAERSVPEQQAIDLFLHATHAGVLEFAWGVLCPGCLAFMVTPGALRSVERKRCNLCHIDVGRTLDDRVEVAFTVAPSVRRIRFHTPDLLDLRQDGIRCHFSSSLSRESLPHQDVARNILHAGRVAASGEQTVSLTLPPGVNFLLAPGCHAVTHMHTTESGPRRAAIELLDGCAIPEQIEVAAGPVELQIHNRLPHPAGYFVAPLGSLWPEPSPPGEPLAHPVLPYLSGPRLVTSQVFRDLFRAESIPSEGGLELKSITVMFTDLKGSTAIYERIGDIRAYDLVRRHFAALRSIASVEGGAIVKTIGDAVMATFAEPIAALHAAIRMHAEVARLGEGELSLKIGVHTGSCIAVELNDRLDYFGRTVNIAARVQGIAGPGEIVCTQSAAEMRGVSGLIREVDPAATRELAALRGIADQVPVVRLRPRP